jgi:hypothetical protein
MRPSIIEFIEKASKVPELDLRAIGVPCPRTMEELTGIIDTMGSRNHDYGTCVYAMSISAVAAFNYIGHVLGVTGFQAFCADLDFLRRTRDMKAFKIMDMGKLVYPQYRDHFRTNIYTLLNENAWWIIEFIEEKLASGEIFRAHPDVVSHWLYLWERYLKRLSTRSRAWILIDEL